MKIKMSFAGKMTTYSLLAAMMLVGVDAAGATVRWDGGGDGTTWEDPLNWDTDALPTAADLAFNNGFIGTVPGNVTLNSNQEVDAVRFAEGRDLTHTGGTLTVGTGGTITISHFPEFGTTGGVATYTMSGTAIYNQTDGGRFNMSRIGTGGELFMSDNAQMTTNGEIWFGMDANFTAEISDNATVRTTDGGDIFITRFVSPSSTVTFKDSASLQVDGALIMSEGTAPGGDAFAGTAGNSTLTLNGSSLDVDLGGLTMRSKGTLEFIADVSGISTIGVDGAIELLDNRGEPAPQLVVDLSLYGGTGPITLIDNTSVDAVNGTFLGLAEGATVAGTGGLTISYVGGDGNDIVLVPEPASLALLAMGGLLMATRRRRGSDN